MPSFTAEPFPSDIGFATLALVANKGSDVWHPSGTAVLIAPGLALTAKHVVDDYFVVLDGVQPTLGSHGKFGVAAYQPFPGNRVLAWEVSQIFFGTDTDLALLELRYEARLPEWFSWPELPILDLWPPAVGAAIIAYGYPGTQIRSVVEQELALARVAGSEPAAPLILELAPRTSAGHVLELHHLRRDSSSLTFPAFRTNTRFDGGMSGGPVVNERRELCGVVCSSISQQNPVDEPISYVSSLWPAMGIELRLNSAFLPSDCTCLLDLVHRGLVRARNAQHVKVTRDHDDIVVDIGYYRAPGETVSRRLQLLPRLESIAGYSAMLIDQGAGPTFRGNGDIDYRCPTCDSLVADGVREGQILDVVVACSSCGAYLAFEGATAAQAISPFGTPIVRLQSKTYRLDRTLNISVEGTIAGSTPILLER